MPDPRKKARRCRRRDSRPPTDRSTILITIGLKRGAEEIVENQVVSSKKQKIVDGTSSGMSQPAVDTMIRKKKKKKKKREKKQKNKLEKMVVEKRPVKESSCEASSDKDTNTLKMNKKERVETQKTRQEKKVVEKKPVKESSCETSSDKEEEPKKPVVPETKIVAASNKDGSSHKSESEDRSDEEVENVKLPEVENRYVAPAPVKKKVESSDDSDDWDPPEVYSSKEQFVVPTSEKPDEEPKEPVKDPVEAKTKNGVMEIEINLGSPFPPPGGSNLVFMINLSPSIQESDVIEFFKDDDKIDWVRFESTMIGDRYKGYGHVRFNTSAAAQKALKRDKEDLIGYPVTLIESEERTIFDMLTPSSEQKYLFMGNLSPSVTKRDIIKFFEDAGKVVSVRLISAGGHFKGYGHVEFASSTVAHKAIRQYGQMLHGRYVELAFATERTIWHTYTPSSGKPPGFGVLRGPGYGPTKDRFRCVCTLPVPETCRRKKNQSRCRSCHRLMKSV